jgi:hypothetical protein
MQRGESVLDHQMSGVPEHESYEQLCALAAGGMLESTESLDFLAHLKQCSECQFSYRDLSRLINVDLPQAQGPFRQKLATMRAKPMPYSRQRFLHLARTEGIVFSKQVEARSGRSSFRPVNLTPIALLVVVALSLLAYYFRETPSQVRKRETVEAQQLAALRSDNSTLIARQSQMNEALAAGQRRIEDLRTQLGNITATAENLRRNSEQARGEAERFSSRSAQLLEESRNQEKLLAEAREESSRINQLRTNDEASLVEQQARITDLSNKLRIASATLETVRQLTASGQDIRELLAARQLHVIDVRDTDPNGNQSKAFGRVFLSEGKALTFYGFDLDARSVASGKRSFHVWAVAEGDRNSARSLGTLRADAKAPGRWVLRVENPEFVKNISSVYVTLESAASKQPTGEKMLYAYLGEPNHP